MTRPRIPYPVKKVCSYVGNRIWNIKWNLPPNVEIKALLRTSGRKKISSRRDVLLTLGGKFYIIVHLPEIKKGKIFSHNAVGIQSRVPWQSGPYERYASVHMSVDVLMYTYIYIYIYIYIYMCVCVCVCVFVFVCVCLCVCVCVCVCV